MLKLTEELSDSLDQAAALIRLSKHVVALAGAGLSVESGIPPFRGAGGLWSFCVTRRSGGKPAFVTKTVPETRPTS